MQTCAILETRGTVANAAVGMHQGFKEGAHLLGERMLTAVSGSVEPPDLSQRRASCQRVEHCQHRGHPDAGTQKNDGCVAGPKREVSSRRAHVHDLASLQLVV